MSSATDPCEDVSTGEGDGDRLLLDRTRTLKACLKDTHQELPLEEVVLKLVSFRVEHILRTKMRTKKELARSAFDPTTDCFRVLLAHLGQEHEI